jgi:hypothetical protein
MGSLVVQASRLRRVVGTIPKGSQRLAPDRGAHPGLADPLCPDPFCPPPPAWSREAARYDSPGAQPRELGRRRDAEP